MAQRDATTRGSGSARNTTADKTMDILLLYSEDRPVLSAADVARELGTSRSATYRYLQSLRTYGFVDDAGHGRFRLGSAIFELARVARIGLGLSELALPIMRELVARLDQTVLLTKRFDMHVVAVEREEPRTPIRLSYERGHVLPLHAGASARVLLAFDSDDAIRDALDQVTFTRFTPRTITDARKMRRALRATREQGYAVSRGEVDAGVIGVAAPVAVEGEVVAGLSVVDFEARVDDRKLDRMIAEVRTAADELAERLLAVRS
jgi:DNA-binding IclR family transcriptional regulator